MDAFSRKKERLTLNTQELNLHGSKKKVPLGCQGQVDCLAGQVILKLTCPILASLQASHPLTKLLTLALSPNIHIQILQYIEYISFKK